MNTSKNPEMSVIIISYNTREMTLACVESVYRETCTPFEIIVVDNASSDGSAQAIAEQFPDVVLIAEQTNHGFAAAHPIAISHTRAPWFLLLNPDTIVLNRALDKLLAFAGRAPEALIWGGRTLDGDRKLNPSSCWRQMSLWSLICQMFGLNSMFPGSALLNSEAYGGWQRDTEREVDIVTGCLFLIQRETWEALGGFDPAFKMYGEEADLCIRAKAAGARPMITPEATIVHYGGASERVRADKMVRLMRAKTELAERHLSPLTRGVGRRLLSFWPLSRAVALGMAGLMLRRADLRERSKIWSEIWERRAEWRNGV